MVIQQEYTASEALENAWKILDDRYSTPQRSAQHLMGTLLQGPRISAGDPDAMLSFASKCEAAVFIRQKQNLAFAALDDSTTQQTMLARLSEDLHGRWCEYRGMTLGTDHARFEQFST